METVIEPWGNRDHDPEKSYYGLQNQGATCYLNSVLQVLFMTPGFRKAVLSSGSENEGIDHELKKLFEKLRVQPTDTCDLMRRLGIASGLVQGDAAEFFENVLSRVQSEEASQIFQGKLVHTRVCGYCRKQTSASEPFWHLTLEPTGSYYETFSVLAAMETYFGESHVTGADRMYCDGCHNKTDATIHLDLEHHPEVLTLLVKRFHFHYRYMEFVKNKCVVVVPYRATVKGQRYELYAFVEHLGELKQGHYTATIKPPDDGKWYFFSDTRVSKLQYQPSHVDNEYRSLEAYLLFYRKEGDLEGTNGERGKPDVIRNLGRGDRGGAGETEGPTEVRAGPAAANGKPAGGAKKPPKTPRQDKGTWIQDGCHEARRVAEAEGSKVSAGGPGDAPTRGRARNPPSKSEGARGNQRQDRGAKTRGGPGQNRGQRSRGRGCRPPPGNWPSGRLQGEDRPSSRLGRAFPGSNEPIAEQVAPEAPRPPSGGVTDFLLDGLTNMTLRDADWTEQRGGGGPSWSTADPAREASPQPVVGTVQQTPWEAALVQSPDRPPPALVGTVQQTPWEAALVQSPDRPPPALVGFYDPQTCLLYPVTPQLPTSHPMFQCSLVYYPPGVEQGTPGFQPMPPTGPAHHLPGDSVVQGGDQPRATWGSGRTRGPPYWPPTRSHYGERGTGV